MSFAFFPLYKHGQGAAGPAYSCLADAYSREKTYHLVFYWSSLTRNQGIRYPKQDRIIEKTQAGPSPPLSERVVWEKPYLTYATPYVTGTWVTFSVLVLELFRLLQLPWHLLPSLRPLLEREGLFQPEERGHGGLTGTFEMGCFF